jgi:hypothetical protein
MLLYFGKDIFTQPLKGIAVYFLVVGIFGTMVSIFVSRSFLRFIKISDDKVIAFGMMNKREIKKEEIISLKCLQVMGSIFGGRIQEIDTPKNGKEWDVFYPTYICVSKDNKDDQGLINSDNQIVFQYREKAFNKLKEMKEGNRS